MPQTKRKRPECHTVLRKTTPETNHYSTKQTPTENKEGVEWVGGARGGECSIVLAAAKETWSKALRSLFCFLKQWPSVKLHHNIFFALVTECFGRMTGNYNTSQLERERKKGYG